MTMEHIQKYGNNINMCIMGLVKHGTSAKPNPKK